MYPDWAGCLAVGQHHTQAPDESARGGLRRRYELPALACRKKNVQMSVPLQGSVQARARGIFKVELDPVAVGQFVEAAPGIGGHQAVALGQMVA